MEETKQKLGNAPAFASVAYSVSGDGYCQEGLTIREYFAAKAMQGIVSNQEFLKNLNADPDLVAQGIIEIADKVLERLANEA